MQKRKSLFIGMCLTLLLASGCASKSTEDNSASPASSGTSTEENVTLKVWGDTANQATLEGPFKLINEAFTKKYPNIKVDYQWSETEDSLNVALTSNSLPDAFYVQGNKSTKMAEMVKNKQIIALDEYAPDASRFPQEAVDYAKVDGKIYSSFPTFFDYVMVYYNKDIFEKNNLQAPKTWDDFVKINDTLLANGVTPIAFGGNGDFDRYWPVQVFAPALMNDVMIGIADKKTDIDFAPMTELFNTYAAFAKKGYFGKDYVAMDGKASQLAFTNGKAAMIMDGTWSNSIYEGTSLKIGRFAIPDKTGVKYAQSGMNNSTTYAVAATSKHPKEAAAYANFLSSVEATQFVEDANGNVPIVKDIKPKGDIVAEFSAFDKIGKNIYHALSSAATDKAKPQDLLLTEILPKLMTGKITGEEATKLIQDELNKK
ncbi:extracellular solute-binding protein [Paenibacillus psychroresistens]|uniref:Extracellular solute-binding protein n=1 Tax=Paenibacillus psychroresistens TaxID=1778678 RepID=A0A6B8RV91_9BACL|nr:extracellular solute-binding protein [Paenibacillus psychroresistens]QGQ99782.1 extracellular solute-binding protein [Paenibacillus psychroresistens]